MPKPNKKKSEKGKKKPILHRETKQSIIAIVCFAFALISLLSFFGAAGVFGRYFYKLNRILFGRGFFLMAVGLILVGLAIITSRFKIKKGSRIIYQSAFLGIFVFIVSILGFLHIFAFPTNNFEQGLSLVSSRGGGYLGLAIGYPLIKFLGFWAGLIILAALLVISVLIFFNIPLRLSRGKEEESGDKDAVVAKGADDFEEKKDKTGLFKRIRQRASREIERAEDSEKTSSDSSIPIKAKFAVQNSGFKLPPLEFLNKDKGQPTSGDIKANINIIKRTLENFGIEVEMAEVNVGPTVTQYTLRPAQGIKLSRIMVLQNDLSLALAAHPLRIEAPIPGRSLVGIEIPNKSVVMVRLGGLLEKSEFQDGALLSFALGRDVAGNPMFADLARMPHILIAGATGTGKTIALNNIITSLLYKNSPESLKLILIDPKRVELTAYESIPHLLTPVIVQSDKAVGALRWAVGEMERRFEVLHKAGKRDIGSYILSCQESKNNQDEKLPFIVVVIDELADLMSTNGREAEAAIVRLAQMARAVGIHLVVSTQRPSVEVITGLIKANITSRIAFQVASQIDSRTILDMGGADKLLGNGDMLFLSGNSAKPRRVQGAYISDKEVKKVTDYLKTCKVPDYEDDVVSEQVENIHSVGHVGLGLDSGFDSDDELYGKAKEIVIQSRKASASLLQRRLRVGYARAARLLDILEEQGVVGPADGARPRDVYIDEGADKF